MESFTAHTIPAFNITSTSVQYGNAESSQSLLDSVPCSPYNIDRLDTLLYTHQSLWRWFLCYGLALRLAWSPAPRYAHVDHAIRRRLTARVCEYASRRRQAHEQKVGRRLGRVQKAQGTRSACPSSLFLGSPFPNCLWFASQTRHYLQYLLIQTSYPCTTLFSFQRAMNSISCSSPWRGICISSSSPAMVVAPLQVVSSHPFSDRLSRAYITSMLLVTFIGT